VASKLRELFRGERSQRQTDAGHSSSTAEGREKGKGDAEASEKKGVPPHQERSNKKTEKGERRDLVKVGADTHLLAQKRASAKKTEY